MSTVFQVHTGCRYEGGSTAVACSTREIAMFYVKHELKQSKKWSRKCYGGKWKEELPGYWSDGMNVIVLIETRLY